MDKKILIIDDSLTEISFVKEILISEDYQVETCMNPLNVFGVASSFKPDLIMLDIIMPEADGYKTIRKLKSNTDTSSIPVIFMSSKNLDFDIIWGKKQGASDYVTKPIKKKLLLEAVQKAI